MTPNQPYPIKVCKFILIEKTGEISNFVTELNILNQFLYSISTIHGDTKTSLEKLKNALTLSNEKIKCQEEIALISPYEDNFVLMSFQDNTIHTINKMPYIGLANFSCKDFAVKLNNIENEDIDWRTLINLDLLVVKNLREETMKRQSFLKHFKTSDINQLIDLMKNKTSHDIYPKNFNFKMHIYYPNNHSTLIEYLLDNKIEINLESQKRWLELEKRFQSDKVRKETLFDKFNLEQQLKTNQESTKKIKL